MQCVTFSKSLNPRNIDKSVSDIRIPIRFPFESSFWISVSGCKLTIQPDIQLATRIVIISVASTDLASAEQCYLLGNRACFCFGSQRIKHGTPAEVALWNRNVTRLGYETTFIVIRPHYWIRHLVLVEMGLSSGLAWFAYWICLPLCLFASEYCSE